MKNLSRSQQWFRDLYEPYKSLDKYDLFQDKTNEPIGQYIGHCVNHGYKYAIVITNFPYGKYSNPEYIKELTSFFVMRNFKVFHVHAYNNESFNKVVSEITQLRSNHPRKKGRR